MWKQRAASPSRDGKKLHTTQLSTKNSWLCLYKELVDFFNSKVLFNVLTNAEKASTTDYNQALVDTLVDNERFWSSKSSTHQDSSEFVIYSLKEPLCVVKGVNVHVYQAGWATGRPTYSPQQIQISVGFSVDNMHYTSPAKQVQQVSTCQQFQLDEPQFGCYVRLDLIGRAQREPYNRLFYTVIRYVEVVGVTFESFEKEREYLAEAILQRKQEVRNMTQVPLYPTLYNTVVFETNL
jgi:hypothetical protein